jgi:hypothetical protein
VKASGAVNQAVRVSLVEARFVGFAKSCASSRDIPTMESSLLIVWRIGKLLLGGRLQGLFVSIGTKRDGLRN